MDRIMELVKSCSSPSSRRIVHFLADGLDKSLVEAVSRLKLVQTPAFLHVICIADADNVIGPLTLDLVALEYDD